MIVWFSLLVPIATAIVLHYRYKRSVSWWEFFVPLAATLVFVFIAKALTETAQTSDTEYWGGWAVEAHYYEEWNSLETRTVTERDSNGNTTSRTETYVDNHPAEWRLIDSNGFELAVSSGVFEALAARWRSREFRELNRRSHTRDGDLYVATFPGNDALLEPVTTMHRWENRVQASSSVMRYNSVSEDDRKRLALFHYPKLQGYLQRAILGDGGPTLGAANRRLEVLNAKMGAAKKLRMYVLVFKNQPLEAAIKQEALWQGGNKNEFVLTIGVDNDYRVQWGRAFSWTPVESLKTEAREFIGSTFIDADKPLDLHKVVDWMSETLGAKWEKRDFKEFNYLSVEPPLWAVILCFALTIALNFGVAYWIVTNEHSDDEGTARRRRAYY